MVNINCAEKASKIMKEAILEKVKMTAEEIFYLPQHEIEYLCRSNPLEIVTLGGELPGVDAVVRSTIHRIFYAREVPHETEESADTKKSLNYPKLTFRNLLKKWFGLGVLEQETFEYTKTTTKNIKKYEMAALNSRARKELLNNDFPEVYEFYEPPFKFDGPPPTFKRS